MKYRIEAERNGAWWWYKTYYWIVSDYGKFGPFDSAAEAGRCLYTIERSK